jgi:uncharacterized protein (DUF362 family)
MLYMKADSEVSIARCPYIENPEEIKKSLRQCLKLLGGLEAIVRPGDRVILKPNLLLPVNYLQGAVTNPYVAEALIDLLHEIGVRRITIAEGSVVGEDTAKCFESSGFKALAERKKINLVDLKKDDFSPMGLSTGKMFRILKIPKTIAEADAVINLPVLKTHDCFPVSLGLKNMKGVIHERDKQKFHLLDLAQCVVDLNKLVLPQLTIIDGTVGMEGMGPVYGEPANMKLLIASFDTVAGDAVGSAVMGIDPYETKYIRLAEEQGLGCADLSKIRVVGETIENVRKIYKRVNLEQILESESCKEYNVKIHDAGACSGCRSVVTALISDLMEKKKLSRIQDSTIIMGRNISEEELHAIDGHVILFGACTKTLQNENRTFLKGCPPHILDVKKDLGYTKDDFENFDFLSTHLKSFGWS